MINACLRYLRLCGFLMLGVLGGNSLYAQGQPAEGWYLSLGVSMQSLAGDFDGEQILVAQDEVFLVPNIETTWGMGGKIGYRTEIASLELSVIRGQHQAGWASTSGDAVLTLWSLDFQYFFLPQQSFQPFVQLGWSPATPLRVKDASAGISGMEISDAIYIGELGNFNAGGGACYFLNSKVCMQLAVLFRKLAYGSVQSEQQRVAVKIDQALKASEVHLFLSMSYIF